MVEELTKEANRFSKLEKKLEIKTHGYTTREKLLKDSINRHWSNLKVRQIHTG